jgi:hypothetical protein
MNNFETISYGIWDTVIFKRWKSKTVNMFVLPLGFGTKTYMYTNMFFPSKLPEHTSFDINYIRVKTGGDIKFDLIIGSKIYYQNLFFKGLTSFDIIPLRIEKGRYFNVCIESNKILPFKIQVALSGYLTRPVC